ncbi:hypothetical protein SEA_LUCKYLEO_38 [Gordonia phage LuckyLeo]|nr:hypothetical protein SEA_LUCKYLEO_38 [Gordonia phage LuckyLeo]
MRWPWGRGHRDPDAGIQEAKAHLMRLERQDPEVTQLAEVGRRQLERNHLGEGIERAMRRRYA